MQLNTKRDKVAKLSTPSAEVKRAANTSESVDFCHHCGARVKSNDKICVSCGKSLVD
jgi:predicted amidophosphoribosyltransferase